MALSKMTLGYPFLPFPLLFCPIIHPPAHIVFTLRDSANTSYQPPHVVMLSPAAHVIFCTSITFLYCSIHTTGTFCNVAPSFRNLLTSQTMIMNTSFGSKSFKSEPPRPSRWRIRMPFLASRTQCFFYGFDVDLRSVHLSGVA